MKRVVKSPGHICAWCGRHGGKAFPAAIDNCRDSGVNVPHPSTYAHSDCMQLAMIEADGR